MSLKKNIPDKAAEAFVNFRPFKSPYIRTEGHPWERLPYPMEGRRDQVEVFDELGGRRAVYYLWNHKIAELTDTHVMLSNAGSPTQLTGSRLRLIEAGVNPPVGFSCICLSTKGWYIDWELGPYDYPVTVNRKTEEIVGSSEIAREKILPRLLKFRSPWKLGTALRFLRSHRVSIPQDMLHALRQKVALRILSGDEKAMAMAELLKEG